MLSRFALASTRTSAFSSAGNLTFRRFQSTATSSVDLIAGKKKKSKVWLWTKRGILGSVLVVAGGVGGLAYQDLGFRRSLQFWYYAMPMYIHYRLVERQVQESPEWECAVEFNALHDRYARRAFDSLLKLRGFYVKVAQLASVREDILPKQYMELFSTLQVTTLQSIHLKQSKG